VGRGYLVAAAILALPVTPPGWFEHGSLSFAVAANSVAALAGIVTAVIAAKIARAQKDIAREQKEIARGKLRLDLFERRFALYKVMEDYLVRAPDDPADPEAWELVQSVIIAKPQAYFLFGEEIGDYFEIVKVKGLALRRAVRELPVTSATVLELSDWFKAELAGLHSRFAPYLSFENWR
jgi:hypothetical protein